jgi:phenylpyruvate tautomerase PptA (4-oxalocrotonate tautomerase family)
MIGFEDKCDLYFQGNNNADTAFVEVKIFGSASKSSYNELTKEICVIFNEELGIAPNRIYVKYEEVDNWGWNGANF